MKKKLIVVAGIALLTQATAHAMNAEYRRQLERSGCTQVTEAQGCDINKTKAENAKAGFVADGSGAQGKAASQTPYAGQWVAKSSAGATVATILIDAKERVWVNGKRVTAKRSDGGLVFHNGTMTFMIQGDRRLKGEDIWSDSNAGTKGPIVPE